MDCCAAVFGFANALEVAATDAAGFDCVSDKLVVLLRAGEVADPTAQRDNVLRRASSGVEDGLVTLGQQAGIGGGLLLIVIRT